MPRTAQTDTLVEPSVSKREQQIAELQRRARQVQNDLRKMSPDVVSRTLGRSSRGVIVGELRSDGVLTKDDHECWLPETEMKEYASRGYEPVIRDGDYVIQQGDYLAKTDNAIYLKRLRAEAMESHRRTQLPDSQAMQLGLVDDKPTKVTAQVSDTSEK